MIKIDAHKDFFNKKFVSALKFSTKFFRLHFLIVKSPNQQDSYTTYPKISANQEITPNKCRLFIIMSHINFDNSPHSSKKNHASIIVRKNFTRIIKATRTIFAHIFYNDPSSLETNESIFACWELHRLTRPDFIL